MVPVMHPRADLLVRHDEGTGSASGALARRRPIVPTSGAVPGWLGSCCYATSATTSTRTWPE